MLTKYLLFFSALHPERKNIIKHEQNSSQQKKLSDHDDFRLKKIKGNDNYI